jgi:DUF3093 family protein
MYREILWPPLSWWLGGTAFCATCWWAIRVATTPLTAWSGALIAAVAVFAWLISYGRARVEVDVTGLRAGRARLPWRYVGAATGCDAAETKSLLGVGADARAYLLIRPYVRCSVKVTVDDIRDPAPYWLVSTRRPDQLAACLNGRDVQH